MSRQWTPLESNPEAFNKYMLKLGIPKSVQCYDLFGFDDELLSMIPGKPVALMFVFPITTEKLTDYISKLQADSSPDVYFIPQTIGNACGTMALIHALANNGGKIDFGDGLFTKFYESTKNLSPSERAKILEVDNNIRQAHESCAGAGDTVPPPADADVDFHYVAFVQKDNKLLMLDGRKDSPLKMGDANDDTFFKEAAKCCQKFASLAPGDIRFTAFAMSVV